MSRANAEVLCGEVWPDLFTRKTAVAIGNMVNDGQRQTLWATKQTKPLNSLERLG